MNTTINETSDYKPRLIDIDRAERALNSFDSLTDLLGALDPHTAGVLDPHNLCTLITLLTREIRISICTE